MKSLRFLTLEHLEQQRAQLRKLRAPFKGWHQLFSVAAKHTTEAAIRMHGRMVAVRSASGWQVRRNGVLEPAGPGLSALYEAIPEWSSSQPEGGGR